MSNDFLCHRQSFRLDGYDYSQNGMYFITICACQRQNLFGEIRNDEIVLNTNGQIVFNVWQSMPSHHFVILDEFQIMPNHLHGIVQINRKCTHIEGESRLAPTLGMIIGFLKSESTKQIRRVGATRGSPFSITHIWQRNYYEHIIRNENEYFAIKQYIRDNVKNWDKDENNV